MAQFEIGESRPTRDSSRSSTRDPSTEVSRDVSPHPEKHQTNEEKRLAEDKQRKVYWKRWGPYLSERQWATVREDYSSNGDAWNYFPYEMAISRAFRWGEDGIAGFSDTHAFECISFAFWNEKDDFLKERLFGLTGPEGNHGEDVKEEYFYLDCTPTHSYMNYLYKYPQKRFPYQDLRDKNKMRTRHEQEYELIDTGIFEQNKYWDIYIETAKSDTNSEEIYFKVTAYNRGPDPATLDIIPQIYFRNTWGWEDPDGGPKPSIKLWEINDKVIETDHWKFGKRFVSFETTPTRFLFTDNETNKKRLWGPDQKNDSKYVKDAFHEFICDGKEDAVNPDQTGTKSCAQFHFDEVPSGESVTVRMKFSNIPPEGLLTEEESENVLDSRIEDADEFYFKITPLPLNEELQNIQRQAFAGMLWNKQYYQFIWEPWAYGDPDSAMPPPPERKYIRNWDWKHLHIDDILSMPDKWEYPFFASWDSAFHCVTLAMVDPEFAKKQLDLLCREWYMHPNGQVPAYEWNFSDVNPPVQAWATWRVFKIDRRYYGDEDLKFLERVFQKMLLNFTWWVNQKDANGRNVFEGGFLGMDNIGLFNRSEALPTGGVLEQADGTGWMAFYCLQMLCIALELAKHNSVYEDIACKFFVHFIFIADAMSYNDPEIDGQETALWDETDGFYYDRISWSPSHSMKLPVRSLVGLIPLFAVMPLDAETLKMFPAFTRRVEWFIKHRPSIASRNMASLSIRGEQNRLLLSLVNRERLERILSRMLDRDEFLSDYGIRSMSKFHHDNPYSMDVDGQTWVVDYEPGESTSGMFGGNSNWRGPIWFPINFLLIESLQRFFLFYGKNFTVKYPSEDGEEMTLARVAENLQHGMIKLFLRDEQTNRRPYNGNVDKFDFDQYFDEGILFHEYFDPDTGRGLGTKHQCGWTGLVAKLIQDTGMSLIRPGAFGDDRKKVVKEFFDETYDTPKTYRRYRRHRPSLSRSNSTARIIDSIGELLDKYSVDENGVDETL